MVLLSLAFTGWARTAVANAAAVGVPISGVVPLLVLVALRKQRSDPAIPGHRSQKFV
jgi:hypothetical protein